jgi:hypothetical protein
MASDSMKFHTSAASGLNSGQFNRKRSYIFVINDVVSYERFRVDVRPEPFVAENQTDCVHPLARSAYKTRTQACFAPLAAGKSLPGRAGSSRLA